MGVGAPLVTTVYTVVRGDRGGGGLTKVSPTTAEDEDASSANETERQARRSGVQVMRERFNFSVQLTHK